MLYAAIGLALVPIGASSVYLRKHRMLSRVNSNGVEHFGSTGNYFRAKAVDGVLKVLAAVGLVSGLLYLLVGTLDMLGR